MHGAKEDLNPLRGSYERTIVRLGGLARMHALVPGAVPAAGVAPGGPAGVPCAQPLVGGDAAALLQRARPRQISKLCSSHFAPLALMKET